MTYNDDSGVKIDGVLLPGVFKSIEVTTAAEIEEQEVEGSTAQPKQATGYEDGKVNVELLLEDSVDGITKEDKFAVIQNFFRQPGQDIPAVHTVTSAHTAQRNISQVLFKNLITKETNANDQLAVTLEFWEYVPMTISITTARSADKTQYASDGGGGLGETYKEYLKNRGAAPKQTDKTGRTPAQDTVRAMEK